jgi:hypothetical protein
MNQPTASTADEQPEPAITLVRTFAVRHADEDLGTFVGTIVALLEGERALIDLSHHDRHATTVELRVTEREASSPYDHHH